MPEETVDSALDLLNLLKDKDEATISFKKVDGTTRLMKCTLNFEKIPKKDKPKNVNVAQILKLITKNKVLRVYDLENHGWRSIPFDRTEWVETDQKRYKIKK